MDSIVGYLSRTVHLSRTMQSLSVAMNAKGGDCWHVYMQSVLFIDGKNNNDAECACH
jgi:hypothetical protein